MTQSGIAIKLLNAERFSSAYTTGGISSSVHKVKKGKAIPVTGLGGL
jgi:hypothetical protein